MQYDVFFSISHTPVQGVLPTERQMWQSFFSQVKAADAAGYGTAWVACSHLSTEVQKQHRHPVVPHWQGEIGLNNDIFQLAHQVFGQTRQIKVGSAIMNLLCNGGPVARAEQLATFASLRGVQDQDVRPLKFGFAAGRFDFMSRAYGVVPRNPIEEAAWKVVKGKIFSEASEIFLRLMAGETLSSDDIAPRMLTEQDFRSAEEWQQLRKLADSDTIALSNRWVFEPLKIVPQEIPHDRYELYIGSHDPDMQVAVNEHRPVKVFNLSITKPEVIDGTHARMTEAFHPEGGPWKRAYMPRTVMVFLNEQPGLTPEQRREAAGEEARKALAEYWKALQGTIDPQKIEGAANNALVGNATDIAQQICERYHPDDTLMLWFDFFNHDCERVVDNIRAFADLVIPAVEQHRGAG